MVILLGFFFTGVSSNSVIATSGVVTFDELLTDGKSMLSIGIMIFVSSRYGASAFTQKSYYNVCYNYRRWHLFFFFWYCRYAWYCILLLFIYIFLDFKVSLFSSGGEMTTRNNFCIIKSRPAICNFSSPQTKRNWLLLPESKCSSCGMTKDLGF